MTLYTRLTLCTLLFFHITAEAVTITPATNKIANATVAPAPQTNLQSIETKDFHAVQLQNGHTTIPFAAQHIQTYAGENAPVIEQTTLQHKDIKVNVQAPASYVLNQQYTAQELYLGSLAQTHTDIVSTGGAYVAHQATATGTEIAATALSMPSMPIAQSFVDRWRSHNRQVLSSTESPRISKRRAGIIDTEDPDDPDIKDPYLDSIGSIPFSALLLMLGTYVLLKKRRRAET